MKTTLEVLLWASGILLAISSLAGAWLLTGSELASDQAWWDARLLVFFLSGSPLYLMIMDLWPRRWNLLVLSLQYLLLPQWRIIGFDLITVAALNAYPILGLVLSVSGNAFIHELQGWIWMSVIGSIHFMRRKRILDRLEERA